MAVIPWWIGVTSGDGDTLNDNPEEVWMVRITDQ